jgi:hypothetical protein
MQPVNLVNFLSYGAIGLGLALAILAYLLLRTEQAVARPRRQIMTAIYVFMAFSLVLSVAGFASELLRSDAASVPDLRRQLDEKNSALAEVFTLREVLAPLLELKVGKIDRLKQLDPGDPAYFALVNEIQLDLEALDRKIQKALGEP